jgi:hypothetical protein
VPTPGFRYVGGVFQRRCRYSEIRNLLMLVHPWDFPDDFRFILAIKDALVVAVSDACS